MAEPAPTEPEPEAPDDLTAVVAEVMEADREVKSKKKIRRMVEAKLGLPKSSLDSRAQELNEAMLKFLAEERASEKPVPAAPA